MIDLSELSLIADILSIIGFIVTIFTFFLASRINRKVKNVKNEIVMRNQGSVMIKNLEDKRRELSNYLGASYDTSKIKMLIGETEGILENLETRITGSKKSDINMLVKNFRKMRKKDSIEEREFENLHSELGKIISRIKQEIQNKNII